MTRVKDRSANVCGVHNLVTTGVTTADHPSNLCSLRLVVRTPGFHLGNRSSTLLGSTSLLDILSVLVYNNTFTTGR